MEIALAQRLKVAMRKSGLTQAALAEKAGISQAAIQKISSGKSQSTTKLLEISRALQVRPEWLGKGISPMSDSTLPISHKSNIDPEDELGEFIPWDSQHPISEDDIEVPYLSDIEFAASDGNFCKKTTMVSKFVFLNLLCAKWALRERMSFVFQTMGITWSRFCQTARL